MGEDSSTTKPQRGARRGSRKPELRIVLDTNQLYTGSASDLLRQEVVRLIEDSRRHKDVRLVWYLPEVVQLERKYQMLEAARGLLPSVEKLERLLGHGLSITDEILADRVSSAVGKQVAALGLHVVSLDPARVDWPKLIDDAASRKPPFEAGKHEKGFRDAIVAETFLQLVSESPKSPSACRIALVTADGLLGLTLEARTYQASNVRILRSLDDLSDLINTLVADVTEEFVKTIREEAAKCFFVKDDKTTLYYKMELRQRITAQYEAELHVIPAGAEYRKNGTWYISQPRFSKKVGQKVHWVSTIRVAATAYKRELTAYESQPGLGSSTDLLLSAPFPTNVTPGMRILPGLPQPSPGLGSVGSGLVTQSGVLGLGAGHLIPPSLQSREVSVADGQSVFEVLWSVTVAANRRLTNAKVDEIQSVGTTWEGGPAS